MKGIWMEINRKAIKKVKEYKKKGLGVREISRLMKKDPTQILRWLNYSVDSYPQKKVKKVLTIKNA